jgi:hypothetical protein
MQTITAGTYKAFDYTFFPGSNTLTVYDLFDTVLSFDSLALLTLQRNGAGVPIYAPSLSNITNIAYSVPIPCPSAGAPTSGGSITFGLHSYAVSYTIGSSETLISSKSNVINASTGAQTVAVTLPVGPIGTVARNLYRSNAGDTSTYYLISNIFDNSTLIFSDTTVDNQTTLAPTTSNAYDIFCPSINTFLSSDTFVVEVRNQDQTYDLNLNIQKTIPQVMSELPPADPETSFISDTNLAAGTTYFYEMPQGYWRNFIFQMVASCSSTGGFIKLYKTLDPAAAAPTNGVGAVPSASSWFDCTEEKLGFATISVYGTTATHLYKNLSFTPIIMGGNLVPGGSMVDMPDRYLLSWLPNSVSNSLVVNVRKF